ncbi:MAG: ADP-forming succinate--CoA ligase subunit beta [Candidatus Aminicenantales bacterium]|jgi:succinyl-CoA synthetase beta subunit
MRIHEYQAKRILAGHGLRVPRGEVADSPDRVGEIARKMGSPVVLKAQVHAGGRGRGGGIRSAETPERAEELGRAMIGMNLVTTQTGPGGKLVRRLLVEEAVPPARELYLGVAVDRGREAAVVLASTEGGMAVEEVAVGRPEAIFKEYFRPGPGLRSFQARSLAFRLGLTGDIHKQAVRFIDGLTEVFESQDASLVEVNPLVVTPDGNVLALDAKMTFDDNALFRHPDIRELRDPEEESPLEVEAERFNLQYIKLEGRIGCLVNGAGLAMATMDLIRHAGGTPANFLDIGGGASEEGVANAFRILVSDPGVRAALINIFGGIVRCDLVANGIVRAARELRTRVPVVIRFEGTNVEEGKRVLRESGLAFHPAAGLKEAADMAVALSRPPGGESS